MRHQPLVGYILHARAYQEKRAIYRFFCQNNGVVEGVGVRGLLSFVPITLFATGKSELKRFSEPNYHSDGCLIHRHTMSDHYYGALYVNELLHRLLPKEEPAPNLWREYQRIMAYFGDLSRHLADNSLKYQLRCFECALFIEMGVDFAFNIDSTAQMVIPNQRYYFYPSAGFVADEGGLLLGDDLLLMERWHQNPSKNIPPPYLLNKIGQIHRLMIDELLDYKPLNSRKLWADKQRLMGLS